MSDLFVEMHQGIGRPLVLFHGWGFDSRIFLPLLPALKPFFDVFLVDLPGFGQSKQIDLPTFQKTLLKQLPHQFAVLGWSMGGGYAIQLASLAPERITHLIGVGVSPKFIADDAWPGISCAGFDDFMSQLSLDPIKTLESFVQTQTGKPFKMKPTRLPNLTALETGLHLIKTWDLRNALKHIKQACFMFGRLDTIVPVATLEAMQHAFPQFEYVLFKREAHIPFISNEAQFLSALHSFLPSS